MTRARVPDRQPERRRRPHREAAARPSRPRCAATGVAFRVERTHSIEHARELARSTVAAGELAAAMGGDGLLGAVAGELRGTDGALAVLPGGRGNDFARKLGLGTTPWRPATSSRSGASSAIDVADVNGRAYLGIASSGLDSDAGDLANATKLRAEARPARLRLRHAARGAAWRPAHWEVVARRRAALVRPATRSRSATPACSAAGCTSPRTPGSTTASWTS